MNLKLGDMAEIIDYTRGLDDRNSSYVLSPGDAYGIIVDLSNQSLGTIGLLIAGSVIYVPERAMVKMKE